MDRLLKQEPLELYELEEILTECIHAYVNRISALPVSTFNTSKNQTLVEYFETRALPQTEAEFISQYQMGLAVRSTFTPQAYIYDNLKMIFVCKCKLANLKQSEQSQSLNPEDKISLKTELDKLMQAVGLSFSKKISRSSSTPAIPIESSLSSSSLWHAPPNSLEARPSSLSDPSYIRPGITQPT